MAVDQYRIKRIRVPFTGGARRDHIGVTGKTQDRSIASAPCPNIGHIRKWH
jgi:hypothetical protein